MKSPEVQTQETAPAKKSFPVVPLMRESLRIGDDDMLNMQFLREGGAKITTVEHPGQEGVEYRLVTEENILRHVEKNGARLPVAALLQRIWTEEPNA